MRVLHRIGGQCALAAGTQCCAPPRIFPYPGAGSEIIAHTRCCWSSPPCTSTSGIHRPQRGSDRREALRVCCSAFRSLLSVTPKATRTCCRIPAYIEVARSVPARSRTLHRLPVPRWQYAGDGRCVKIHRRADAKPRRGPAWIVIRFRKGRPRVRFRDCRNRSGRALRHRGVRDAAVEGTVVRARSAAYYERSMRTPRPDPHEFVHATRTAMLPPERQRVRSRGRHSWEASSTLPSAPSSMTTPPLRREDRGARRSRGSCTRGPNQLRDMDRSHGNQFFHQYLFEAPWTRGIREFPRQLRNCCWMRNREAHGGRDAAGGQEDLGILETLNLCARRQQFQGAARPGDTAVVRIANAQSMGRTRLAHRYEGIAHAPSATMRSPSLSGSARVANWVLGRPLLPAAEPTPCAA